MESEQATPVDIVQSSMKVPESDKYLKKARRHIGRNVVEITIKMKTLNDKNHQASSQKFRQLNDFYYKNALEMSFTLKNALEMIFTIKMHWK